MFTDVVIEVPCDQYRPAACVVNVSSAGRDAQSDSSIRLFRAFTGSPRLGAVYHAAAGSSTIEPGITPARAIDLEWRTFDEAADQAGLSRRYGGIHFRDGDLKSRQLGRQVGEVAWKKALAYFGLSNISG